MRMPTYIRPQFLGADDDLLRLVMTRHHAAICGRARPPPPAPVMDGARFFSRRPSGRPLFLAHGKALPRPAHACTAFVNFRNLRSARSRVTQAYGAKTRLPLDGGPVGIPFGIRGDFHGTTPPQREAGARKIDRLRRWTSPPAWPADPYWIGRPTYAWRTKCIARRRAIRIWVVLLMAPA